MLSTDPLKFNWTQRSMQRNRGTIGQPATRSYELERALYSLTPTVLPKAVGQ